jgi:hypothetical protein
MSHPPGDQPQVPAPQTTPLTRPNPLTMIVHIGKTFRLAGAILRDPRVSIFRKLLFVLSIAVLLVALIAPDTIGGLLSEFVIPIVGPAFLGLPADISFDWIAVAVAAYNLMRVFPAEIVAEHYDRLFRSRSAPSKA